MLHKVETIEIRCPYLHRRHQQVNVRWRHVRVGHPFWHIWCGCGWRFAPCVCVLIYFTGMVYKKWANWTEHISALWHMWRLQFYRCFKNLFYTMWVRWILGLTQSTSTSVLNYLISHTVLVLVPIGTIHSDNFEKCSCECEWPRRHGVPCFHMITCANKVGVTMFIVAMGNFTLGDYNCTLFPDFLLISFGLWTMVTVGIRESYLFSATRICACICFLISVPYL